MNVSFRFHGGLPDRSAAILLAILFALPLRGQGNVAADETQALGLRPPTAEEEARMRVLAPRALRVLPNARALSRANGERAAKGLAPLAIPAIPDGEEIIVASTAAGPDGVQFPTSNPATAASSTPGENTTVPPVAGDVALPSAADNSTLQTFPPIRNQGSIGSCACFSSVYYMSTFMVAQARGLNVRNSGDADKLSPKFVYALVNGGSDNGSWFTSIFDVLLTHGAPTWSNWPYSGTNTPSSYLEWPVASAIWRGALANRMASSYQLTDIDTDAGLTRLKTALANGALVVFGSNIYGWDYATASDDPATPDDNAFIGRPVCKVIRIDSSGHAMTIVGYNDNLWVDLNKNGRVDPGEKGALRIANSWGTGWQDGGFVWVAYDALRVTSAVSGVGTDITANRAGSGSSANGARKPFWDSTVYGLNARTSYAPQLLAEFTLKGVQARNQLGVTLGRGADTATAPSATSTPSALKRQGGAYALNGTSAAVDGIFVFDLTDLRQSGSNRYFVTVRDYTAGSAATFDSMRLLDGQGNAIATGASGLPASVDNSIATAFLNFSSTTAAPVITSALTASGTVNAAFTYLIAASNVPTSFNATNLPAGLTVSTQTGAISGTPLAAGSTSVAISATNSSGTDTRTLAVTIAAAVTPPVISSATTTNGTSGAAFTYQIVASGSPTSYGISGTLPNGITLNTATGLLSGTPAQTGTFNVQVQATNIGGTTSRALAITIAAPVTPVPAITSATTASVDAGNLFNYRIQASGATSYGAQSLPTGLTVDSSTGVITGRVSLARTYQITLLAINATGTGYATLTLEVRGNSSFAPANDNFANRITLSGASVSTTGANTNASAESGEPAHAGSPAATSVWWSWIAPSSGTLTLSTAGSVPTMRSALYTGGSVSSLAAVAPAAVSVSTFTVTSGTTYHIAVDSIANNTGSIALSLSLSAPAPSRPANDNFASAFVLTGNSANASAVTTAATAEIGEPSHGSGSLAAKSVWYRWAAPAAGRCTVSTRGSDFDTLLAIYTGTAVNALTLVARDDDSGGNATSETSFSTIAGTTYNIAVDGFIGASGNVALSLVFTAGAAAPANDNFASATALTGTTANFSGSTAAASRESSEPAHAGYTASRSVWFRWTAPTSGLVLLSTVGSSFDTLLAVYTGSTLANLQPIISDDDSGGNSTSLLAFNAISGTVYMVAVDGYAGAAGNYSLSLTLFSGAPANDSFSSPATLTAGVRVTALNTLATAQVGEPAHFTGVPAAKSLWWRWTATSTGFVSVTTAGSTFDTVLAVYTGSALNALTLVARNDEASSDDFTSTVFFRAVTGRTYLIAVDSFFGILGDSGTVALTLTPSTNPSTVYATDFERFTPGAGALVNQDQWSETNASSATNAQGVLTQGFSGQGRAGYIGYGNPDFSSSTATSAFVFRSLNFDPIAEGAPIVQMRADISIIGSTNGRNDFFYLVLYNRAGSPLAGFYFDTASRRAYAYDGSTFAASSFTFSFNTRYTVLGTFNFATRRWTARIGSTELVTDSTFAASATAVDVGNFAFVWTLSDSLRRPGDNFMFFDNLAITADPVPTALPTIQLPAAPSGSLTVPLTYNVTATNGPILSYSATGLPPGLSLNSVTGLVSGTATQAGTFNASFTAANSRGQSATTSATFTILSGPPAITSAATATATLDRAFSFQITATNSPRRFGLRGTTSLPNGLSLDTTTGTITGTPRAVGRYQLTLSADNDVGAGTAPLELIVDNPDVGRLINLSILAPLVAGETMTMGTVLGGVGTTGSKALVARAAGPALTQLGVTGVLPDPAMKLNNTSVSPATVIATNEDWGGSTPLSTAFAQVGAFPYASPTSKDAGLSQPTLAKGNYTIQVSDNSGGAGTVIAEIYDATPGSAFTATTPRLINVSVLKQIAAGTSLTAGFVIGGSTNKTVLVRAVGPTLGLAPFNIGGVMADPKLELFNNTTGAKINENNDWGTPVAPAITTAAQLTAAYTSVGAFQLANTATRDAVLLVTLAPGQYSARVSGANGDGGIAIVEVYEVP